MRPAPFVLKHTQRAPAVSIVCLGMLALLLALPLPARANDGLPEPSLDPEVALTLNPCARLDGRPAYLTDVRLSQLRAQQERMHQALPPRFCASDQIAPLTRLRFLQLTALAISKDPISIHQQIQHSESELARCASLRCAAQAIARATARIQPQWADANAQITRSAVIPTRPLSAALHQELQPLTDRFATACGADGVLIQRMRLGPRKPSLISLSCRDDPGLHWLVDPSNTHLRIILADTALGADCSTSDRRVYPDLICAVRGAAGEYRHGVFRHARGRYRLRLAFTVRSVEIPALAPGTSWLAMRLERHGPQGQPQ